MPAEGQSVRRARNPSTVDVFTNPQESLRPEMETPPPKRHQKDGPSGPEQTPDDDAMEEDYGRQLTSKDKKKGRGTGKPKRKPAKPLICSGVMPLDLTTTMRDARVEVTIGQLMSMDKLP